MIATACFEFSPLASLLRRLPLDVVPAVAMPPLELSSSPLALLMLLLVLVIGQQLWLYIVHQRLRKREELFRVVTENAADMIALVDLKGRRLYNSPSYKRVLGYSPGELSDTSAFEQIHPEDRPRVLEAAREASGTGHGKALRYRIRHKNGTWRVLESNASTILNRKGEVEKLVVVNRDVTAQQEMEEQLAQNSFHDGLTGLPNRRLFMDRLQRSFFRAQRDPEFRYAVLYVDLDGFKELGEHLGRSGLDLVIVELGRRLRACLRHDDTLARPRTNAPVKDLILSRLGDDEFTILLDGIKEPSNAMRVARRIQAAASQMLIVDGRNIRFSVSVGIALNKIPQDLPEVLLHDADSAMRRAKAMGRGRCEVFDESMHNRAVARLKLEAELNDAIDGRQLSLYYQPVIRLATGHLAGFEALLRWNHPDRGATSPYCFLEAAEATGVTLSMGKFAIAETCRQVSDWNSHYPEIKELGVAINLSPKQFADPDLICHIRNAIGDHRLPASSLQVELTENVLTADPSATVQVLHSLKQLGLRILIDDFGVGHLPLAHLAKFAVDAVKIDRSLIAGMLVDRATLKMVDAIITLVHKLKLEAVAKGVEKAAQLEQLMAMGCDLGQGFLFSQPLTAEACNHILSGRLSRAPISEG